LGGYTETPSEYQEVMDRLLLKHGAAKKFVPAPEVHVQHGASIGIIAVGGCNPACLEALDILRDEHDILCDYMRIKAFPFSDEVEKFINAHDMTFVVEQNRDAQLKSLLTLETSVPKGKLLSIISYGGFPLSAKTVVEGIMHKRSKRASTKDLVLMEE
jgi:2-oxoglutarate ferredoxin oxidoreductase subunit alpha